MFVNQGLTLTLLLGSLINAFPSAASPAHGKRPPEGNWTALPSIGSGPRQEHGTGVIGIDIYVVGGIPPDARNDQPPVGSRSIVEKYSIDDGVWTEVTPLPIEVTHANVAGVNGKLYVLGALTGDGVDGVWREVPDCFVYDPAADEWTALEPIADGEGRGASAIGVRDGVIYLAGGMRSLGLAPGGLQDSVDIVTAYDVESNTWTTLPSLPAPRDHVGGVILGNTFFVVGGRNNGMVSSNVWSLNLGKPKRGWMGRAVMPTARGGLAVGSVGKYIVAFGGEGNEQREDGVFDNTEMYDTRGDTWTKLDPMPVPRHGTIAVSVGGKIYIPGGGINQGAGPVSRFDVFSLETC